MLKTSIILSFFNRVDYLKLVLASLEKQSFKAFELIIADDGSNSDVVNKLEKMLQKTSFASLHVWQKDKGFRKNRILNRAVKSASTNYLIFIDGDCVLHPKFIEEHYTNRLSNTCLTGRRVNLSKKITDTLTKEKIENNFFQNNFSHLVLDGIFGNSYDVEKCIYFKSKYFRKLINSKNRGILGCNFSLFKNNLLKINGFDERYEEPSIGEDSDVQFRLELENTRIKSLNNIAIQYHLFHTLQKRSEKNLLLFESVKNKKRAYTNYGIKKTK